jgi:hypothetical protein
MISDHRVTVWWPTTNPTDANFMRFRQAAIYSFHIIALIYYLEMRKIFNTSGSIKVNN